mmetsp:Transcript_5011/g.14192  ORF Transcript_5011/g.14192 Transcript_5011/m.14192 type:complete len:212 (-) Transcript_5011:2047-2682(-)
MSTALRSSSLSCVRRMRAEQQRHARCMRSTALSFFRRRYARTGAWIFSALMRRKRRLTYLSSSFSSSSCTRRMPSSRMVGNWSVLRYHWIWILSAAFHRSAMCCALRLRSSRARFARHAAWMRTTALMSGASGIFSRSSTAHRKMRAWRPRTMRCIWMVPCFSRLKRMRVMTARMQDCATMACARMKRKTRRSDHMRKRLCTQMADSRSRR